MVGNTLMMTKRSPWGYCQMMLHPFDVSRDRGLTLTKTHSDCTLLGRTSSEVFVMLVVVFHSFLFFILLLFFICCCPSFISRLLYHATGTPPWLLRPVGASTCSELYPGYFNCLCLFIYRGRYGFEWAFFNHTRFFTLFSFLGIFYSTRVYEGLPGGRPFFLEVCRAS